MPYTEATSLLAKIILMAAKTVGVPGSLLLAICVNETKLTHVIAVNDGTTNTYGICQVKHETAQFLGFKGNSKELMSAGTNATYAAKYLRYQLKRYNGDACKATAAYNLGSYRPSKKWFGKPSNFGYIERVANVMNYRDRDILTCSRKVAELK
jgi:soluble lytic murein transglycosylase-like protein